MLSESCAAKVKQLAIEAGFHRCGIAPVGPFPDHERFREWIDRGYAGEMAYLSKDVDRRIDVRKQREWVRSVIVLALDYNTQHPKSTEVAHDKNQGWISRYAWGTDYHDVVEGLLKRFVERLNQDEKLCGNHRYYVDHGPILEKVFAKYAGLGWIGKNTMLIHPKHGSYCFLAVVLTDLDLTTDAVMPDRCGSCTRCVDACPTEAFIQPYLLDARRCISYWTIEQKQAIPDSMREAIGFHIFGCDICQDVCPWNRKAKAIDIAAFEPRPGLFHPELRELAGINEEQFRAKFTKSPIKRRKYGGFLMNIDSARKRLGKYNWIVPNMDVSGHRKP